MSSDPVAELLSGMGEFLMNVFAHTHNSLRGNHDTVIAYHNIAIRCVAVGVRPLPVALAQPVQQAQQEMAGVFRNPTGAKVRSK